MFEHRSQPLISRRRFAVRMATFLALALSLDVLAVAIGAVGFHGLEGLGWLDATLNGAMVVTGNGPIQALRTPGGKVFAIFEALLEPAQA